MPSIMIGAGMVGLLMQLHVLVAKVPVTAPNYSELKALDENYQMVLERGKQIGVVTTWDYYTDPLPPVFYEIPPVGEGHLPI